MGERRNTKEVLWDNVLALMQHHYGAENLTRLAREAKIGPGTATRIKEANTSVGLDVIERIARRFKLEPYQLLCVASKHSGFLLLCQAYNEADDRGREFLVATAETALNKRGKREGNDKTGTGD